LGFIEENTIRSHIKNGVLMKYFLTFLLVLIFPFTIYAQTNWFTGTFDEAQVLAQKEGKRIFIHSTSKGG